MSGEPMSQVAVIIPYYNGSKFIEQAIESVFNQTVPADEVVVVNDGSKLEEREFLESLKEKFPCKILDQENGGQGSARNTGVAATISKFICFLDQDDVFLPNHIKDLLATIPTDDPRFGFAYADLCLANAQGDILHSNRLRDLGSRNPKWGSLEGLIKQNMFVMPQISLICRTAFNAVGGFDPQFRGYEDDDLFLRLFLAGYTNYFLDRPVTIIRTHNANTSKSVTMMQSRFKYFKKLLQKFYIDPNRDYLILKKCLIPRFGSDFYNDVLVAICRCIKEPPENIEHNRLSEAIANFSAYASIVNKNKLIKFTYRMKLKIAVFLITKFPICFFRALYIITPGRSYICGFFGKE